MNMIYSATITSQGQVTIPIAIRKQLKTNRVIFKVEKDQIIIKSEPDFMDLAGVLHHKAIKNKSIEETMALEKKAIEDARAERYIKQMKKMGIPIPK